MPAVQTLNAALYERTQELQGMMFQAAMALSHAEATAAPPPLLQVRRGWAESPAWLLVQAAEFEPEPLSVERLRVRAVWSSERLMAGLLEIMAAEKWFERSGGDYSLLAEGQRLKTQLMQRPAQILAPLVERIWQTDLIRLEHLLARIIDSSTESGDPPGNWCIRYSRRRAPSPDRPSAEKLFHHCVDFNAFRDDCHMAAWRPLGIPALDWEAFDYICTERANTVESIVDNLVRRGYAREEMIGALEREMRRGDLVEQQGSYHPSDQGRAIYEQVERLTDQYFFAPWLALGQADLQELLTLLEGFETELKPLIPAT
jgi:hypothetical protein